ncbi:CYTH and CHAD domain-containing protein [Parafrankia sp. EUN1f]|uniref:CYTH and CHAD domain-containing protein n=1 Tax=Parafrankia sp. EUN1f TaxID=102897 RepID=UPI0001C45E1E|nr:CYTH and CHAD domain-containing protein [Parafrankia sp. EUN1f]EFC83897.1 CHAD domain containing protein [Parafrankia sp. EUN1f]
MGSVREIERKYSVDPGFMLPKLAQVPGVSTARTRRAVTLEAIYHDTEDLRLARNRITLRRRTGGPDAGWHLKLPVAPGARDEIQRPLGGDGAPVPADLVDLVTAYLRGAALRPVARLVTLRTARRLRDDAGADLAEVVDDQVSATILGSAAGAQKWREIEVELGAGDPALLDEVERVLLAAGAGRSASASKLAQVLGPALAEAPGPDVPAAAAKLRRRTPAGTVIRAYLIAQVETLLATDPRVRLDAPDAVHRMRVACRRTRSTLRTFAPFFPAELVAHLDGELRDLAGALSGARDAEVQIAYFTERLAELPAELVRGDAAAVVSGHLAADQNAAREEALAMLRSARYLQLLEDLIALVNAPLTGSARKPAEKILPGLLHDADRRLTRKVARAGDLPIGLERDELLHSARKQAKRLRYAAEAVGPVYGSSAAAFARLAESMQELLGTHQDATIARGLLRGWGVRAQEAGDPSAFTLGVLLGLEEHRARTAERDFFDLWPAASARRHRRWFR